MKMKMREESERENLSRGGGILLDLEENERE